MSCLLVVPGIASADIFKIAITSPSLGINTTGTFTASDNTDGSFTVTGLTGSGITGLVAAGDPFFGNDNLLFPTGSRLFDVNGFAFTGNFSGQALSVNIFSTVSGFEALAVDSFGSISDVPATASLIPPAAVTPEPSSMLLSGTGLLAMVCVLIRKRLPGFVNG